MFMNENIFYLLVLYLLYSLEKNNPPVQFFAKLVHKN